MMDESEYVELLKNALENNPRIYYKINHVAKSGMSRSISFYIAMMGTYDKTPVIQPLTGWIAAILHKKLDKHNGITVSGCGMDMGYHVINNLSMRLYCPDKYDHDAAFRLKGEQLF